MIEIKQMIDEEMDKIFNKGLSVFICFKSESVEILAVASSVKCAQEICCCHGDRYFELVINKDYGRESQSADEIAIYNIDGNFIKGYSNTVGNLDV